MQNVSVLIVDDELPLAEMVKTMLLAAGYQCTACQSVSEALSALEMLRTREGPKIILLDWEMPPTGAVGTLLSTLDARRSELRKRLSTLHGKKHTSEETFDLRRKLNDIDDDYERLMRGGGEFLHIISDQLDEFGVIILSGHGPMGVKAPADIRVLQKPCTRGELIKAIQECCDRLAGC